MLKVVRWDNDAITHEPLRMQTTTKPNLTCLKLFAGDIRICAFKLYRSLNSVKC
jgi:hypothetical protein